MKPIDIILLIIIALAVFFAVLSLVSRKRKGDVCSGCPGFGTCGRDERKNCARKG